MPTYHEARFLAERDFFVREQPRPPRYIVLNCISSPAGPNRYLNVGRTLARTKRFFSHPLYWEGDKSYSVLSPP